MALLHILAYGATGLGFAFLVFSLACGLYYLSELIEEYTVFTRKIIKGMTYSVIAIHILLLIFDGFPFLRIGFSLACHGIYSLNLKTFPFISLTGGPFVGSCVVAILNHFIWFRYFAYRYATFMDVAAFFGICVWLIPFVYFISLSANDNALPISDPVSMDAMPNRRKEGLLKSLLKYVGVKKDEIIPSTMDSTSSSMPMPMPVPPSTTAPSSYTPHSQLHSQAPMHYNGELHARKML